MDIVRSYVKIQAIPIIVKLSLNFVFETQEKQKTVTTLLIIVFWILF